MTRGKQWEAVELPLDDILARQDFQFRREGLSIANLNKIIAALKAGGETRDPVRVARVGKLLYLVDGFHRLEAYRRTGKRTIPALVAKMSLEEARGEAMSLNAKNGLPYNRSDKQALWQAYVDAGSHLEPGGKAKASRAISAELGGAYSHETVRTKIKAMGLEFDEEVEFGGSYKPLIAEDDEEACLEELAEDAEHHLQAFGALVGKLQPWDRERLLKVTKGIVSALELDEEPDMHHLFNDALPF